MGIPNFPQFTWLEPFIAIFQIIKILLLVFGIFFLIKGIKKKDERNMAKGIILLFILALTLIFLPLPFYIPRF